MLSYIISFHVSLYFYTTSGCLAYFNEIIFKTRAREYISHINSLHRQTEFFISERNIFILSHAFHTLKRFDKIPKYASVSLYYKL